jgi:hypothetical protein
MYRSKQIEMRCAVDGERHGRHGEKDEIRSAMAIIGMNR